MLWDVGEDEGLQYMFIFGIGLAGKALTLLFLVIRLEMFKVNHCKKSETSLFSSSGILDEW